ncbi:MAG: cytochrome c [Anaerolineae bacterium]|nr:cytochrome c [Anaerolineae bacterium]
MTTIQNLVIVCSSVFILLVGCNTSLEALPTPTPVDVALQSLNPSTATTEPPSEPAQSEVAAGEHNAEEADHHEETDDHHADETDEHHAEGMDHEHAEAPANYQDMTNPLAGNAEAIAAGQKIYEANCVTCHGPQGEGDGPAAAALDPQPASLADKAMMQDLSDGYLFWRVSEGGAMPPFNSAMLAWKGTLSEEEIWQVISYVRTFSEDQPEIQEDTEHHEDEAEHHEDEAEHQEDEAEHHEDGVEHHE